MAYKLSHYNISIKKLEGRGMLIFNSRSTSLGVMSFINYDYFTKQIVIKEEDNLIPIDVLKLMAKNGFIVTSDTDEIKQMEAIRRMTRDSSPQFGITIAPTMSCNMACSYCYEEGAEKPSLMKEDVQLKLLKFIKDSLQVRPKGVLFSVTWYGGEPLLALDTIRYLSSEFKKIAKERELKYRAGIITNGVLLTQETAQILTSECSVTFAQITLDGFMTRLL